MASITDHTAADQGPPNSLEAEQALIGCCLASPQGAELLCMAREPLELFYREAHKVIAGTILELSRDGAPTDVTTVHASLIRQQKSEYCGGRAYLLACWGTVGAYQLAPHYLRELERCRAARKLIQLGHDLEQAGYENPEDPARLAGQVLPMLDEIAAGIDDTRRSAEPIGEHVHNELLPRIRRLSEEGDAAGNGVLTGWQTFDRHWRPGGFMPGRVTVLQATRKAGKSTLGHHMTGQAGRAGLPVAVYSAEMSRDEVIIKLACIAAGLNAVYVERGMFRPGEEELFEVAASNIAKWPLYIEDERGRDVHGVIAWARRISGKQPLALLVIDYLQLLAPHLSRETMERNISDASRRLSTEAQRLNCHVLLLSQLNVQGFAKWSGQTNDDAHCNWSVTRVNERNGADAAGRYMRFALEQRFGKSGVVDKLFAFDGRTGRITESMYAAAAAREEPI